MGYLVFEPFVLVAPKDLNCFTFQSFDFELPDEVISETLRVHYIEYLHLYIYIYTM